MFKFQIKLDPSQIRKPQEIIHLNEHCWKKILLYAAHIEKS